VSSNDVEKSASILYICAPASWLVADPTLPINFPQLLHTFVLKVSAQSFGPSATAESSLTAVPSSPRDTSIKRKAGLSKSDRQNQYEPFQDHRVVEMTFCDSVDECPNSKSLFERIHREQPPRSQRTKHPTRHLSESLTGYHIRGSPWSPRKSMNLFVFDVLVRVLFVGPPGAVVVAVV
jgi:hypothetical protein